MVTCREMQTDVLVIGGGAAGMMASIQAAKAGCNVLMITDGACASTGILGFNALVSEADSRERFCGDIIQGGWELSDPNLVEVFVDGTSRAVRDLEEMGVSFDRTPDGSYHLLQPLGCSVPRLVHSENKTGTCSLAAMRAGMDNLGVAVWEHTVACGLRCSDGRVTGAWAYSSTQKQPWCIRAKAVVIATGGGHMLKGSTYPVCQTGDGYAMGYRAGARLRDMEFFQHEPCRAIWPKPLGISTTLLAKGGKLTNALGERFVLKTYPSEGAVPKDALAKLIDMEIKAGRGTPHRGVWLDLTDLPEDEIRIHHALYYRRFMNEGIDLCKERVEVAPAAHSIMGGICVDTDCRTDTTGLFAAGEAMGGLHGACRLGGNAGSEVYVFGAIAGKSAARYAKTVSGWDSDKPELEWNVEDGAASSPKYAQVIADGRAVLSRAMGPIRDGKTLKAAMTQLQELEDALCPQDAMNWNDRIACFKAQNLLLVGKIMLTSADLRTESRGVHFRQDYPQRDDLRWKKSILVPG